MNDLAISSPASTLLRQKFRILWTFDPAIEAVSDSHAQLLLRASGSCDSGVFGQAVGMAVDAHGKGIPQVDLPQNRSSTEMIEFDGNQSAGPLSDPDLIKPKKSHPTVKYVLRIAPMHGDESSRRNDEFMCRSAHKLPWNIDKYQCVAGHIWHPF